MYRYYRYLVGVFLTISLVGSLYAIVSIPSIQSDATENEYATNVFIFNTEMNLSNYSTRLSHLSTRVDTMFKTITSLASIQSVTTQIASLTSSLNLVQGYVINVANLLDAANVTNLATVSNVAGSVGSLNQSIISLQNQFTNNSLSYRLDLNQTRMLNNQLNASVASNAASIQNLTTSLSTVSSIASIGLATANGATLSLSPFLSIPTMTDVSCANYIGNNTVLDWMTGCLILQPTYNCSYSNISMPQAIDFENAWPYPYQTGKSRRFRISIINYSPCAMTVTGFNTNSYMYYSSSGAIAAYKGGEVILTRAFVPSVGAARWSVFITAYT